MSLSNELISQFVKATKDNKQTSTETTVYGTAVIDNGKTYVRIDGSDLLTPVSTVTDVKDNERVTVLIKDHTATITGNISSPAARTGDVTELGDRITEAEILVADKVSTEVLEAEIARIDTLVSDNVYIKEKLTATEAEIDKLIAEDVTINGTLTAQDASIKKLEVEKLSADVADIKFATIENLDAIEANIYDLEATYGDFRNLTAEQLTAINASIKKLDVEKLSAEQADLVYANIDFSNIGNAAIEKLFADSGIIKDLVVSEGNITGELVGVTIKGDLIEANTLKADKLVVKGSDGLYYKLNFEGGNFSDGEVVPDDSIHGSVITAKSITAEKVRVDDLVAFDATIGGFNITAESIYSGVKASADNTTRGVYLDKYGQAVFGDATNFIKYYKDQNGNYKLEISADSILLGANKKNLEDELGGIIEIGARNLIRNSTNLIFADYYFTDDPDVTDDEITVTHDNLGNVRVVIPNADIIDDGNGNVTINSQSMVATTDENGNVTIT